MTSARRVASWKSPLRVGAWVRGWFAPAGRSKRSRQAAALGHHRARFEPLEERQLLSSGAIVTTLAGAAGLTGSSDGAGSAARFYDPAGAAVDSAGNVYVADYANEEIRKITPFGVVSTLAGSPASFGSSDGTGSAARFDYPLGVAVDSAGNVYVADGHNDEIRKITPTGVVRPWPAPLGKQVPAMAPAARQDLIIPWVWRWTARATSTWATGPMMRSARSTRRA
jgi:hypothetical protein